MRGKLSRAIRQGLKLLFRFLIDERTLPHCLGLFIILIFGFGVGYAWLTPSENGVHGDGITEENFGFLQGIYFSVVTMSSLGYGDLQPKGWSKVLASVEVLVGLLLIGLMIAKLTSWRLSHFVSHLFVSDVRTRLKEFTSDFTELEEKLRRLLAEFSRVYQNTPGQQDRTNDTGKASLGFGVAVVTLKNNSTNLRNYIKEETLPESYFEIGPRQNIRDLCTAIYETFFMLNQCIISLPIASYPEILDDVLNKRNRAHILESIEVQKEFCQIGIAHSKEESIISSLQRIEEVCRSLPASYFVIPAESQPDQMVHESEEPQAIVP